jgi:hypothetical protein
MGMGPRIRAGLAGLALGIFALAASAVPGIALAAPNSSHSASNSVQTAAKSSGSGKPSSGEIKTWQREIAKNPARQVGCFSASYPSLEWHQFACQAPPRNAPPQVLVKPNAHPPQIVGNGTNMLVQATGTTSVTGSFPFVSSSATETENCMNLPGCQDNGDSNTYTLQLNPNRGFSCSLPASDPGSCTGAQQYVYDAESNAIYIQYWLLDSSLTSTSTCPNGGGYTLYIPPPGTDYIAGCYRNSPMGALANATPHALGVPAVSTLGNVTMTGSAIADGNDELTMTDAGESVQVTPPQADIGLGGHWTQSEFGVFGDGYGSQAQFNSGTTVNPLMTVVDGQKTAPTCTYGGFTGETNNLSFGTAPPALGLAASGTGYLYATQSYSGGSSTPSCANATTWGETHLITLSNDPGATSDLTYNFQATGDYTLAQAEGLNVQAEQVADPANTQLAVNRDLGAQIGGANVAVCSGSAHTRLYVNGSPVSLAVGTHHNLPHGRVSLVSTNTWAFNGTAYLIQDDSGNYVEAGPVTGAGSVPYWLDAEVGTSSWPTPATGLLVNVRNTVDEVRSRTGAVLKAPFAFAPFYQEYARSWVDATETSPLSACKNLVAVKNPTINFTASNLKPAQYAAGMSSCRTARVAVSLLDSCILDVATLGKTGTTRIYGGLPKDVTWGGINQGKAATAPGSPGHVAAAAGTGAATVSFAEPASNGGSPITDYTVTATDKTNPRNGGQQASGTAGPLVVPGLVNGDTYTFTVTATNKVGTGAPSNPSNAVTLASVTAAARVTPASYTGDDCPVTFTFNGTITTSGAGSVTYRWIRSDGATGPTSTLDFKEASTQSVPAETWTLGGPGTTGTFWEEIQVLSPVPATSNEASFTLDCTAPAD